MRLWVVDTNILLVARGRHEDISDNCVTACIQRLLDIQREGRVALDDRYLILKEYQNKTDPNRGKDVGQVFLKWLLRNKSNPRRCTVVTILEHSKRGFESFPDDPDLAHFDPADRKFVAVAAACSERPPIIQAADSKWWDWEVALKRHGISVDFLCPQDLEHFRARKTLR